MLLSYIKSFDQFASHLPDENLRKELIEHYEKEVLPTLEGNTAEKMNEFINDYKADGWEQINLDDCPLPDEELDMSQRRVVEKPSEKMQDVNITNLLSCIGRLFS